MPPLRLDHAACVGQPLLVLVSVHEVQQVGVAGELDQIRMGGDQGLAPVEEREEPGYSSGKPFNHSMARPGSLNSLVGLMGLLRPRKKFAITTLTDEETSSAVALWMDAVRCPA